MSSHDSVLTDAIQSVRLVGLIVFPLSLPNESTAKAGLKGKVFVPCFYAQHANIWPIRCSPEHMVSLLSRKKKRKMPESRAVVALTAVL